MDQPDFDQPILSVRGQDASISELLRGMIALKASELFLKTGANLRFKIGGRVRSVESDRLTARHMAFIQKVFLGEDGSRALTERGVADMVYETSRARYRVHFAFGHTGCYATIRIIAQDLLGFRQLGLPESVQRGMLAMRSGLFVVCGSTDAGKTVTCTSFLNELNQNQEMAILTLEDPIEHIFEDARSWIVQREVGLHVPSFAEGVKSALRENVDVIFVGEMRDHATIEQVLRAAEMGHLVVTTLHTDDAISAISRIIGSFDMADQARIRQSLAGTLNGVLYQRLLPAANGGRLPCVEVMWPQGAVRTILRGGDLSKLPTYLGPSTGGIVYRDCLNELSKGGWIARPVFDAEQARLRAMN